jgi:hypothetical protein
MPRPKPRPSLGLAEPGSREPLQSPAPRPVLGPIPVGPVLSPLGIIFTSFPRLMADPYHLSRLGGGVLAGGRTARKHPIFPHFLRRYADSSTGLIGRIASA